MWVWLFGFWFWLIGFPLKKQSKFSFLSVLLLAVIIVIVTTTTMKQKKLVHHQSHIREKWPIQMSSWFSFCYSLIFVCSLTNLTSCLFDLTLFHHHHHYQLLIKKKTPNDRPTYQLQLWYVVVVSCLDKGLQKEKKREKKIRIFCCCSGKTVR
mgnify:CR=1 FL=1